MGMGAKYQMTGARRPRERGFQEGELLIALNWSVPLQKALAALELLSHCVSNILCTFRLIYIFLSDQVARCVLKRYLEELNASVRQL